MSERFRQLPDLRVEKIKKYIPYVLLSFSLAIAPQVSKAQDNSFPNNCRNSQGIPVIDNNECFHAILFNPNYRQILNERGFIDWFGNFWRILPSYDLNNAYYGDHLIGNVQMLNDKTEAQNLTRIEADEGINPDDIAGTIAMDSCSPNYIGKIVRVRPLNSKEAFGPKLVDTDCASPWDQASRNRDLKMVGDISPNSFLQYQSGGIITVEVIVENPNNQYEPDPNTNPDTAIDYPNAWCKDFTGHDCNLDLSDN